MSAWVSDVSLEGFDGSNIFGNKILKPQQAVTEKPAQSWCKGENWEGTVR